MVFPEHRKVLLSLEYDIPILSGDDTILLDFSTIEGKGSFLDFYVDLIGFDAENVEINLCASDVEIIEVKDGAWRLVNNGADASCTINVEIAPVSVSVELGRGNARVRIGESVVDKEVQT